MWQLLNNMMNKKEKVNLGIVTNEPFPFGMAATNRIISYAKEISQQDITVKIYIAKPTEYDGIILNTKPRGNYNNIKFKYVHDRTEWIKQDNKLTKALVIVNGLILLFVNLKKDRPKSIILVSNDSKLILAMWLASKIYKFEYYQEKSEYPVVVQKKTNSLFKWFYLLRYRLFDGIIVMTQELKEFFYGIGQENLFHLPMSVDVSKFSNLIKTDSNKHFSYCGGGNYERDGLFDIVMAFIDICKIYSNYELHIIGPVNEKDAYLKNILVEISKSECSKKIHFIGRVSNAEVPQLIMNAECLIMTPQNDFTSGGFPTKLGEYLSTGNPVICTKVSEIPDYLDDTNAILIDPGHNSLIFKAMEFVIQNPDKCKSIGDNGKLVVQNNFLVKTYIKGLINYLKL